MSSHTPVSHDAAVCRTARHSRVQYLIAADERSLAELGALLATLPICSTGRVFIEVPDESWIGPVDVPSRMIVTWLDRSRRSGAPGTGRGCASGTALTRAVTAWADESMCDDDDQTNVYVLGSYLAAADIVDHLTARLGSSPEHIHTPARFGLATAR